MAEESGTNRRFRENMRKERESLGWSQGELSRRLIEAGWPIFHQTTITRIESGTRAVKLDEAMAIADVLGIDVTTMTRNTWAYVFHRTEQKTWGMRKQLATLGVDYMSQQLALRSAIHNCFGRLGEEELMLSRRMIDETPGNAAMSSIELMMEGEGFTDYEEFREHWRETRLRESKARRAENDDDA